MASLRNVVSWTALIAAYTESGCSEEAFHCLSGMQRDGVPPDLVTYVCVSSRLLRHDGRISQSSRAACGHHQERIRIPSLWLVAVLFMRMPKCGCLFQAQDVFDTIPTPKPCLVDCIDCRI